MVTRSQAVKIFLSHKARPDLANLYNINMECQVNVAKGQGTMIQGEFKGVRWTGWTDGVNTWKSFRIPYNAKSNPSYTDKEMKFDLFIHCESIGMTGWDWGNKVSRWVAFDIDSIVNHSAGIPVEEINKIVEMLKEVEWVTIRRSTSGKGLHLYVDLPNVPTNNHCEHAALARAILGQLAAITGFDFQSKVDTCGGNMWVWHRKMEGTDGLTVIKQGSTLDDIPPNWRDHIDVVKGKRRRSLPQVIPDGAKDDFQDLVGEYYRVPLDESHKKLIEYLKDNDCLWWWDSDNHMLVTHTIHLKEAFDELGFKGCFDTISEGKERGNDHNCFLFPIRKGGWTVRRYTPGVKEHDSWHQDGGGWTKCYFNREPDLETAARAFGGIEDPSGGFIFREAEVAQSAAQLLGVAFEVGTPQRARETKLKKHKDGRLLIEVERNPNDRGDDMQGWLAKGNKPWTRIYEMNNADPIEMENFNFDDIVRHVISETNEDNGWRIKLGDNWVSEPFTNIKLALGTYGLKPKEITGVLGSSILRCWKAVNKPFQSEYPGNREWNRNAAQLRFNQIQSDTLIYPTWMKILEHCGNNLDEAVKKNKWCREHGINRGADYLKCWVASLFQKPLTPLPYLFFFGPQNSGKTAFHDALSLLLTKGYIRAEAALLSQAGYNAELEGAIICAVEEEDLRQNKAAYNRIKDWVTSRHLLVHAKYQTPFQAPNSTHWIQCANDHRYCPIFPGDTRIVMIRVDPVEPDKLIPRGEITDLLEKEAPHFITEVLNLEIPYCRERLGIPVVESSEKLSVQESNKSDLQLFTDECCVYQTGAMIKFSDFYERFMKWIDPGEAHKWSKRRVASEFPPKYPHARIHATGHKHIGNIWWKKTELPDDFKGKSKIEVRGQYLEYA